jgi:hypothetical protein
MDPFGSIQAVVQLTASVMGYLKAMQDAPRDRVNFMIEVSVLNSLLVVLQNRVQQAKDENAWFASVRTLVIRNGPLDRLKSCLERVVSKLAPVHGFQKIGKQITWKFDKTEIQDILSEIERIKTLVSLALANDLL